MPAYVSRSFQVVTIAQPTFLQQTILMQFFEGKKVCIKKNGVAIYSFICQ